MEVYGEECMSRARVLNGTKYFVKAEMMLKMMNVQDAQPYQNVVGRPERSLKVVDSYVKYTLVT